MADQKITELDENTTPVGTDLLAIVDDPGSTPATQKIELASLKATGAEVTTGTDDIKFATSKSLSDADVNTRLISKITDSTRVLTAASGDVSYTGVGFVPSSIRCYAIVADQPDPWSIGDSDSDGNAIYMFKRGDNANYNAESTGIAFIIISNGNYQKAIVKTYDADGFTLTWTKVGSPTGTAKLKFICYK